MVFFYSEGQQEFLWRRCSGDRDGEDDAGQSAGGGDGGGEDAEAGCEDAVFALALFFDDGVDD